MIAVGFLGHRSSIIGHQSSRSIENETAPGTPRIGKSAVAVLFLFRLQVLFQSPQVIKNLGEVRDDGPANSPTSIEFAQEHQIVKVFQSRKPGSGASPEGPVAIGVGFHVKRDEGFRPWRDRPFESLKGRPDMV